MKYLVDANILSEPTKRLPDPRVVDWLRAHEPDIAVDPVILGELRFGILILPKGKKRTALERWFDAGAGRLHCLPWDADSGLKWAELLARLRKTGKSMPIKTASSQRRRLFMASPSLRETASVSRRPMWTLSIPLLVEPALAIRFSRQPAYYRNPPLGSSAIDSAFNTLLTPVESR